MVLLVVSGGSRGETGRTWMLYMSLMTAASACGLDTRGFRILGVASLLVLLTLSALVEVSFGPWML